MPRGTIVYRVVSINIKNYSGFDFLQRILEF